MSNDEHDFHDIDELGEIEPEQFPELMYDESTSIVIEYDGSEIHRLDGPETPNIDYPRMAKWSDQGRIRFNFDDMFYVGGDDGDDVEDTDDEDDTEPETNKHGYDTDGKITMSLSEG